jgi:hypothetical protein
MTPRTGAGRDSRRLRGILRHGVVSFPALQRRNQLGEHPGDYANRISTTPATGPQ